MPTSTFEVRGTWPLRQLPPDPQPWMVLGKVYVVVLRRASACSLPVADVCDPASGALLATFSWPVARGLFVAAPAG